MYQIRIDEKSKVNDDSGNERNEDNVPVIYLNYFEVGWNFRNMRKREKEIKRSRSISLSVK